MATETPIYVLFFIPSCKYCNNLMNKLKTKPELLKKFNLYGGHFLKIKLLFVM